MNVRTGSGDFPPTLQECRSDTIRFRATANSDKETGGDRTRDDLELIVLRRPW